MAVPMNLPQRRWRWLAVLAVGVLAAHALLLFAWMPGWFEAEEAVTLTPPALRVRTVVAAAPLPVPLPAPVAPPVQPAPAARVPKAVAPTPAPPASAAVQSIDKPATSEPAVAEAIDTAPAGIELPTYATRVLAAGSWRYALQRGYASGEARLDWQPTSQGRYTLRLEGLIAGVTVLDWVSTGAQDSAGIAPERFVIRRRGRDSQAANFQRDAGKITFSGPTHEFPLPSGVQDRLTWLLQLAAIVDAAPRSYPAGARVTLLVIGARGGSALWRFAVAGPDRVGETVALKLVHEVERVRDTRVEVWLDPARGHLPLRFVLTPPEGGAPLELQLLAAEEQGSTRP